jgi:hypothetical protein
VARILCTGIRAFVVKGTPWFKEHSRAD